MTQDSGHTRADSPNKSGMFGRKRHSVSEEKALKQIKKIGASVESRLAETAGGRLTLSWLCVLVLITFLCLLS